MSKILVRIKTCFLYKSGDLKLRFSHLLHQPFPSVSMWVSSPGSQTNLILGWREVIFHHNLSTHNDSAWICTWICPGPPYQIYLGEHLKFLETEGPSIAALQVTEEGKSFHYTCDCSNKCGAQRLLWPFSGNSRLLLWSRKLGYFSLPVVTYKIPFQPHGTVG